MPKPRRLFANRQTKAAPAHGSALRWVIYWGGVASIWMLMTGIVGFIWLAHDLPNLDDLPAPGATDAQIQVKARNGALLVRSGPTYGDWMTVAQLPDTLITAFLAVEDRSFFDHIGVDGRGLARAAITNLRACGVRAGGSTITQQLAKNLFLTPERTLTRKAKEVLLSLWLESKFTKEEILALYLNRVYFGGGAYGIDAASRKYFGHGAETLSLKEAAMLAGLVKAPSRLAPHINPEGAWDRAGVVLATMQEIGALSAQERAVAAERPPNIVRDGLGSHVRYFTDWAQVQARQLLGRTKPKTMVITTTLDPALQTAAARSLTTFLAREGETARAEQGAVVALDLDGAILAMVGGRDYGQSQFNRATQARRQPGSAFKLFSYLAAMEAGVKPGDRFVDTPISIEGWAPRNYSGQHYGEMSAREAFARSVNTVAVEIAEQTGRERVVAMARRLGITTPLLPLPSLPLGTEEVRMLDLTAAYAAIGNGGLSADPYGILEISSGSGEVLYRLGERRPVALLSQPLTDQMADMLTSVVSWGSGRNAAIDRPAAGKSGTSQDSRDAVFAGFTSDMAATVWVGNDDGAPMNAVTGGGLPARIWSDFMQAAHAGRAKRPLLADAERYRAAAQSGSRSASAIEKERRHAKRSFLKRLFGGD